MAYDRHHVILRIHGSFGASGTDVQDTWSVGLRLAHADGSVPFTLDLVGLLNSVWTPFADFHSNAAVNAATNCFAQYLSAARVGFDGKYNPDSQVTTIRPFATPVAGSGSPGQPYSSALVTSLRTARPRGYASNGRMYYPFLGAVNGTTGRLSTASVTNYAARVKILFDAVNVAAVAMAPGTKIAVLSAVGGGAAAQVTSVRIDGRMDRQERRENQQPSVYQTVAIA